MGTQCSLDAEGKLRRSSHWTNPALEQEPLCGSDLQVLEGSDVRQSSRRLNYSQCLTTLLLILASKCGAAPLVQGSLPSIACLQPRWRELQCHFTVLLIS